jgi:UDP-glucose 4-epimerase
LKEGDMARRCPDNSKMRELLGRDLISLETGLNDLKQSLTKSDDY